MMKLALLTCVLMLSLPMQLSAEVPQYLGDFTYNWTHGADDVCTQGNYIYVGHWNQGLRVLDATDPGQIVDLGVVACYFNGGMACNTNVLCALADDNLQLFSLEDPAAPSLCAELELDFDPDCFTLDGSRLAVAGIIRETSPFTKVIALFDLSDPENPDPELYYTNLTQGGFLDLKLHGDRLYIAAGDPFAEVVDFSDPQHPQVTSSTYYQIEPQPSVIEAANGYVYVGYCMDGLLVYDEETMQLLATLGHLDRVTDLKLEGDILYAATWRNSSSICLLDLSNPLSPPIATEIVSDRIQDHFALSDRLLVTAEGPAGIRCLLRSAEQDFLDQGYFNRCGPVRRCLGQGNLLLTDEGMGLRLYDLSDEDNLEELSYLHIADISHVVWHDELAFVRANYPTRLLAVDLDNPEQPHEYSAYENHILFGCPFAFCGHWVAVTQTTSVLFFDASNPEELELDIELQTGLTCGMSLIASDEKLVIRDTADGGMVVFDCSGSQPTLVQTLAHNSNGLSLAGDCLYSSHNGGLYMAEMGAPGADLEFQEVTGVTAYTGFNAVAAGEDILLMCYSLHNPASPEDFYPHLGVFDNSNPLNPQLLDYMLIESDNYSISISGERLSLGFGNHIDIYDVSQILLDLSADTPTPSGFVLHNCAPNPFNPSTTVQFCCPIAGHVELAIVDLLGRRIATLANREFAAGEHRLSWNGRDTHGIPAASGSYFLLARFPDGSQVQPVTLLR